MSAWSDSRIIDELGDYDEALSCEHVEQVFDQAHALLKRIRKAFREAGYLGDDLAAGVTNMRALWDADRAAHEPDTSLGEADLDLLHRVISRGAPARDSAGPLIRTQPGAENTGASTKFKVGDRVAWTNHLSIERTGVVTAVEPRPPEYAIRIDGYTHPTFSVLTEEQLRAALTPGDGNG